MVKLNRLGGVRAVVVVVGAAAAMATGTAVYVPSQRKSATPESSVQTAQSDIEEASPLSLADVPSLSIGEAVNSAKLKPAAVAPAKKVAPSTAVADAVRVFYATDRAAYDPRSAATWLQIAGPTLFGVIFVCVLIVRIHLRGAKPLRVIALVSMSVLTVYIAHGSLVEAHQTLRLAKQGNQFFGAARYDAGNGYPLQLGYSDVSLPKNHQKGKVERPRLLRLEFAEQENKHVMLKNVVELKEPAFFDEVRSTVRESTSESTFVFIHGYNVQFDDALMRTAQIAKDLDFDGAPILYSWPSHAKIALYTFDETAVSWSVVHLDQFLTDLCERTGARQIHLVAHSMGNRALLGALERIQLRRSSDPQAAPLFGQVVMAAPDVDVAELNGRYTESLTKVCRQVTLYASSDDGALQASAGIHGFQRAGFSGPHLQELKGIETIDVSPIDTSLLGHSYYGSSPMLIHDIRAIVELGKPAQLREWLTTSGTGPDRLWRFRPELAQAIENQYR